jgi:hypothetical protein
MAHLPFVPVEMLDPETRKALDSRVQSNASAGTGCGDAFLNHPASNKCRRRREISGERQAQSKQINKVCQ